MTATLKAVAWALLLISPVKAEEQLIFLGTYTDGASQGIYSVRLDTQSGRLSPPKLAARTANPAFLAARPDGRVLYALRTEGTLEGAPAGVAASFRVNRAEGTLQPLNSQPAGTIAITHVATDATGRMLTAASFGGGVLESFPLAADGSIGPRASFILSRGPLGPNHARQDKPHPHSFTFSPDNRHAYACDLGRDRILAFAVDPAAATLTPAGEFAAQPGAGPRHSKFSRDGRFFYVANEVNNTVAVYACDPASGALSPRQSLSTLPAGFAAANTAAEIRISPDERFVYVSNRGQDSLAVYSRSQDDGRLRLVEIVPSGGGQPRNFAISPEGRWLVCANRDSNNVAVFAIDPASGQLALLPRKTSVPQAVCVLFVPAG